MSYFDKFSVVITPFQVVCFFLILWFLWSLIGTMLEYLRGQIPLKIFFIGQIINLMSLFTLLVLIKVETVPLDKYQLLMCFFLIIWYSHYIFVDANNKNYSIQQRWLYTIVDITMALTLCGGMWVNIFTTAKQAEMTAKMAILESLDKILHFGLNFGRILIA